MKRKMLAGLAALVVIVAAFVMQGDASAAAALTSRYYVEVSGTYSNPLDLVTVNAPLAYKKSTDLASGTAANQADRVFSDQRTLTASTTEDLDISGTSLLDAFGVAFSPVKVKLLIVCAASTNTNNVVILGDAASVLFLGTAATTAAIKPGGCITFFDPSLAAYTVTATTGDIIQVANGGAGSSVVYDIVIIGVSA